MAPRPKRGSQGARPRRDSLLARWRSWQHHHGQSAAESLGKVLGQPLGSMLTWLVMGIALALPAGLWLMLDNFAAVSRNLDSPAQLTVFLEQSVDGDAGMALSRRVGAPWRPSSPMQRWRTSRRAWRRTPCPTS